MKKRILSIILVLCLILELGNSVSVKAAEPNLKYTYTTFSKSGTIKKKNDGKSVTYIIRTYKELKALKKKIKKTYKHPKKHLKQLNKYKKKFFKKNALCYVVVLNYNNHYYRKLEKVSITKNNKLKITINKTWKYPGSRAHDMVEECYDTYLIKVKKKKIKNIKKIKIKTKYIEETVEEPTSQITN